MPRARKSLISIEDTPYYHCVSRCVRRAFLCGQDRLTGENYEHRRQWVENRLHLLAEVFAIDVCAYAVMSNHTHVVLHINREKAQTWTTEEVILRWHRLHKGTLLTTQFMDKSLRQTLSESCLRCIEETVEVWRKRLVNISWFMRSLNEFIAREANKEDKCTGRFWEGRFRSQALLDEAVLAACMAYVDLNPVRAKMADIPEKSDHTRIRYRINAAKAGKTPKRLFPFVGNPRQNMHAGLPFALMDYIALVDLTGRQLAKNKRGLINNKSQPILERIGLSTEQWNVLTSSFEKCFYCAAGKEASLVRYQNNHQLHHIKRKNIAKGLLNVS